MRGFVSFNDSLGGRLWMIAGVARRREGGADWRTAVWAPLHARAAVSVPRGTSPEVSPAAETQEAPVGRPIASRRVAVAARSEHREPHAVGRVVPRGAFGFEILFLVACIDDGQGEPVAQSNAGVRQIPQGAQRIQRDHEWTTIRATDAIVIRVDAQCRHAIPATKEVAT